MKIATLPVQLGRRSATPVLATARVLAENLTKLRESRVDQLDGALGFVARFDPMATVRAVQFRARTNPTQALLESLRAPRAGEAETELVVRAKGHAGIHASYAAAGVIARSVGGNEE